MLLMYQRMFLSLKSSLLQKHIVQLLDSQKINVQLMKRLKLRMQFAKLLALQGSLLTEVWNYIDELLNVFTCITKLFWSFYCLAHFKKSNCICNCICMSFCVTWDVVPHGWLWVVEMLIGQNNIYTLFCTKNLLIKAYSHTRCFWCTKGCFCHWKAACCKNTLFSFWILRRSMSS